MLDIFNCMLNPKRKNSVIGIDGLKSRRLGSISDSISVRFENVFTIVQIDLSSHPSVHIQIAFSLRLISYRSNSPIEYSDQFMHIPLIISSSLYIFVLYHTKNTQSIMLCFLLAYMNRGWNELSSSLLKPLPYRIHKSILHDTSLR